MNALLSSQTTPMKNMRDAVDPSSRGVHELSCSSSFNLAPSRSSCTNPGLCACKPRARFHAVALTSCKLHIYATTLLLYLLGGCNCSLAIEHYCYILMALAFLALSLSHTHTLWTHGICRTLKTMFPLQTTY
jgi:hypothetical protein